MRLRYSDEDEAFRAELLAWLEQNPPPTTEERVGRRSSADMPEWAKAGSAPSSTAAGWSPASPPNGAAATPPRSSR